MYVFMLNTVNFQNLINSNQSSLMVRFSWPYQKCWQMQLQWQSFNDTTGKRMQTSPLTWKFQDSREVSPPIKAWLGTSYILIYTSTFKASFIKKDNEHTPQALLYSTYQCHSTRCKPSGEFDLKKSPALKPRKKQTSLRKVVLIFF